jgi:CTP:molybdopterin cytidylyltransferase MocA
VTHDGACRVIVLAGDRGPGDPLASSAGVDGKVLVPVGGRPMLQRVLESIGRATRTAHPITVCPGTKPYLAVLSSSAADDRVDPENGPAASAARALERIPSAQDVLLVTGDHPLLRPEWIDALIDSARGSGAEAVVGVVDHAAIRERFEGHRRTHYCFADCSVCGTNLFYFSGPAGRDVVAQWRAFEADRKKPWRIVARLGWWNLMRYLIGRLTLEQATAALSERLGSRIEAVFVEDAEAAVDVDSLADLRFVEHLLLQRDARAE